MSTKETPPSAHQPPREHHRPRGYERALTPVPPHAAPLQRSAQFASFAASLGRRGLHQQKIIRAPQPAAPALPCGHVMRAAATAAVPRWCVLVAINICYRENRVTRIDDEFKRGTPRRETFGLDKQHWRMNNAYHERGNL